MPVNTEAFEKKATRACGDIFNVTTSLLLSKCPSEEAERIASETKLDELKDRINPTFAECMRQARDKGRIPDECERKFDEIIRQIAEIRRNVDEAITVCEAAKKGRDAVALISPVFDTPKKEQKAPPHWVLAWLMTLWNALMMFLNFMCYFFPSIETQKSVLLTMSMCLNMHMVSMAIPYMKMAVPGFNKVIQATISAGTVMKHAVHAVGWWAENKEFTRISTAVTWMYDSTFYMYDALPFAPEIAVFSAGSALMSVATTYSMRKYGTVPKMTNRLLAVLTAVALFYTSTLGQSVPPQSAVLDRMVDLPASQLALMAQNPNRAFPPLSETFHTFNQQEWLSPVEAGEVAFWMTDRHRPKFLKQMHAERCTFNQGLAGCADMPQTSAMQRVEKTVAGVRIAGRLVRVGMKLTMDDIKVLGDSKAYLMGGDITTHQADALRQIMDGRGRHDIEDVHEFVRMAGEQLQHVVDTYNGPVTKAVAVTARYLSFVAGVDPEELDDWDEDIEGEFLAGEFGDDVDDWRRYPIRQRDYDDDGGQERNFTFEDEDSE